MPFDTAAPGVDYPSTLSELDTMLATPQQCRAYVAHVRWFHGFTCPVCGHHRAWTQQQAWRCCRCHRVTSLTAGTILQGTRKPLRLWLQAMWIVASQKTGASAAGLQRVLGLRSYETAWTWMHKLRRAMHQDATLEGAVSVHRLEIIGERVLVAVEEGYHPRCRMTCQDVESYALLDPAGFISPSPRQALRVGRQVERWLAETPRGAVRAKHLQAYLDEFVFRFERRHIRSPGLLFFHLLVSCLTTKGSTVASRQASR